MLCLVSFSEVLFGLLLKKIIYESNINTQSFLISINTNDNQSLLVIRQSGFQPLRIVNYWKRKECIKSKRNGSSVRLTEYLSVPF